MTTLRRGSKGEEVKRLQNLLGGLNPDGIFGAKTEAAVKAFQKANGLAVDGIVGPKTWSALGAAPLPDILIPCEDLKQFSSPHGSMPYGPDKSYSTYANGGCGVASLAIVQRAYGLAPKTEKATDTIQRLGKYSWQHGYRPKGGGTSSGLFKTNGTKATSTKSAAKIEEALRDNKLVILLIKAGFGNGYSGQGHYVVARGIKDGYVLLRDVGSSAAGRQKAPLAKITSGLKYAYIMEVKT